METVKRKSAVENLNENMQAMLKVPTYNIGACTIDVEKRQLTLGSEVFKLTKKEMYLLIFFAVNINKSVVRREILTTIWNEDTYSNSRSLDVYICKMRKLLSKDKSILVVNIHSKGYRVVVD
ncbi:MAG TPA: winged helix-turn-helix domain-containing protein [Paludibacter sp.]|nr:winged helix-turn-helix domain-containing protein [Paludibacter sp.]